MKKHYAALWKLLAVAFVAILCLSALSPAKIGSYELKDSGMIEYLTKPVVAEAAAQCDIAPIPSVPELPEQVVVDSTAKTILFIGDSMLEGLSPRLAAYAKHNGHKLYSVIWYSSTSEIWGRSDKLANYIRRLHPDFVFICLGANELFVKDISTKRDKYVKKIISDIDTIPYLWIGPPNWKPDTGINALIADNTGTGEFFLSDGMHFDRTKDGAHPTRTSAVAWMDSIVRWMPSHYPKPFKLDVPSVETAAPVRIYVHQPNER